MPHGRQRKISHGGWNCHGQIQLASYKATVFIEASTPTVPSVLEAEAQAFLLAARLAKLLQL
jgi:hypothetical protein